MPYGVKTNAEVFKQTFGISTTDFCKMTTGEKLDWFRKPFDAKKVTPLEELDFSVRTYHCLKRAGYDTLADLCATSREDLSKVRNLGQKSLLEITRKLKEYGLDVR